MISRRYKLIELRQKFRVSQRISWVKGCSFDEGYMKAYKPHPLT